MGIKQHNNKFDGINRAVQLLSNTQRFALGEVYKEGNELECSRQLEQVPMAVAIESLVIC